MKIELIGNKSSWQDDLSVIRNNLSYHFDYLSSYYNTSNENTRELSHELKKQIQRKNVLTVAGGNDQGFIFSLTSALKVDYFDIDKMAYYLLCLKKASILTLDKRVVLVKARIEGIEKSVKV